MSDFIEYKPLDIDFNIQSAVENLRTAYWSNELRKVAKVFSEAEYIIVSAICHHNYTVCKEATEGDCISRSALLNQIDTTDWSDVRLLVEDAPTVPLPNEQIAWEQGYEAGLGQGKQDRPQGEWIDERNDGGGCVAICSNCKTLEVTGRFCRTCGSDNTQSFLKSFKCGADMKGGANMRGNENE